MQTLGDTLEMKTPKLVALFLLFFFPSFSLLPLFSLTLFLSVFLLEYPNKQAEFFSPLFPFITEPTREEKSSSLGQSEGNFGPHLFKTKG